MIFTVLRHWFLLAAISISFGVMAQVGPKPLPPDNSLPGQGRVEFLADSTGQWTLNDVRQRAGLFEPADGPNRRLGFGRPVQSHR